MNLHSLTGIAGLGAAAALVASAWSQIRTAAGWARDLFICRVLVTADAADAVLALCWSRGKRSPFGLRTYGGVNSWVQPPARVQLVAFENVASDPILFWFNRRPVIVRRMTNRDEQQTGTVDHSGRNIYLTFIRGTLDMDKFIANAVDHYNAVKQGTNGESKRRRHFVRRLGRSNRLETGSPRGAEASAQAEPKSDELAENLAQKTMRLLQWKPEDLVRASPDQSPFHGFAFPPEVMQALGELELWLKNEKWFRSKAIPWRRGWLLHGPPGCGKSTLTRAMAMRFDLPVFVIDLSTHDNNSFTEAWGDAAQSAPCVVLIEDIDTVFDGRRNIGTQNRNRDALTFDCLLNCLSGVGNSEGIFLVVTTNKPETLDPALGVVSGGRSSRPGRIDRVIELTFMREAERRSLAAHILSDFPAMQEPAIAGGDGMTPAQFQDYCAQLALKAFWERHTP